MKKKGFNIFHLIINYKPISQRNTDHTSVMKRKVGSGNLWQKDELVNLLERRGDIQTKTTNRARSFQELVSLVGHITEEERIWLGQTREKARSIYHSVTTTEMQMTLIASGYGRGSGLGKQGMAAVITQNKLPVYRPRPLDVDQQKLVRKILEGTDRTLLVHAGPGAGKTRTLAESASRLTQQDPTAKILIVMFNVAAEKTVKQRIQLCGASFRSDLPNPWEPPAGITCLTFNKLAYRILNSTNSNNGNNHKQVQVELDDQIPSAVTILQQRPFSHGTWTQLIVDESQDIRTKLVDLTMCLHAASLRSVFAADSRQEVVTGAIFFSQLWTSPPESGTDRITLRFNHRSHPRLVEMLNRYSEFCFPSLHLAQIATSPVSVVTSANPLQLIQVDHQGELAGAIVTELIKYKPEDVYIISPITVEKFGMGPIMLEVRNLLSQTNNPFPFCVLTEQRRYEQHAQVYYAGSSKKLKGTQKSVVFVVCSDLAYNDFGVSLIALYKALFVTLSRAEKCLVLFQVKTNPVAQQSALGQIMPLFDPNFAFRIRHFSTPSVLRSVRVRDDLSQARSLVSHPEIRHAQTIAESCPVFHTKQIEHHEDFMGLFVEALIALGMEDSKTRSVTAPWRAILTQDEKGEFPNIKRVMEQRSPIFCRFEESKNVYRLFLKGGEALEPSQELIRQMNNENNPMEVAYALTVLNFTSRIGRWWVASAKILSLLSPLMIDFSPISPELKLGKLLSWGRPLRREPKCIRSSNSPAGLIVGTADLEFENEIIEVKFGRHHSEHLVQTAIYSTLLQKPARLLNVLEGRAYNVAVPSPCFSTMLDLQTRCWLALKNGYSSRRLERRIGGKEMKCSGAVFVVLDVETHGYPPNGILLEVGACSFFAGGSEIESIFNEVAPGSIVSTDGFCGLLPHPDPQRAKGGQDLLRDHARQWQREQQGRQIALVWGGCGDVEAAGLNGLVEVIDVRRIYMRVLELNGIRRPADVGTTLTEAIEHLSGENVEKICQPHRAIEDVIGLVFVATAIIQFDGTG